MKTTNDLMNTISDKVTDSKQLDKYIDDISSTYDLSFTDYFDKTMLSHNMKKSQLVRESGISRTYLYQMLNGTRKPGRDNAITLCIASHFTLDETIRCLEILNEGILYPKVVRDSLIIYAISHKMSVPETNDLLFSKNEATLN